MLYSRLIGQRSNLDPATRLYWAHKMARDKGSFTFTVGKLGQLSNMLKSHQHQLLIVRNIQMLAWRYVRLSLLTLDSQISQRRVLHLWCNYILADLVQRTRCTTQRLVLYDLKTIRPIDIITCTPKQGTILVVVASTAVRNTSTRQEFGADTLPSLRS